MSCVLVAMDLHDRRVFVNRDMILEVDHINGKSVNVFKRQIIESSEYESGFELESSVECLEFSDDPKSNGTYEEGRNILKRLGVNG